MRYVWFLLFFAACAREPKKTESTTAPDAATHAPTPKARECTQARVAARVKTSSGGVLGLQLGDASDQLLPGQQLELRDDGSITLDFPQGARVALHGASRVALGVGSSDELSVRRGELTVDLAPAAVTAQSGFKLVTPCTTLQLVRGGSLAARVLEDGTTLVQLVAGSATLVGGGSTEQPRTDALLQPGYLSRLECSGHEQRIEQPAATLEQAATAVAKLTIKSRTPRALIMGLLDDGLLRAQSKVESELLSREQLRALHRQSVKARDGRALELQRDLAVHAEKLARVTSQRDALVGQRRAAALGAPHVALDPRLQTLLSEPIPAPPCP